MTYPDECIERAERATRGPWKLTEKKIDIAFLNKPILTTFYGVDGPNAFVSFQSIGEAKPDAEFIAHSRTDVVELAMRLKRACVILKNLNHSVIWDDPEELDEFNELIDELEAPLEKK